MPENYDLSINSLDEIEKGIAGYQVDNFDPNYSLPFEQSKEEPVPETMSMEEATKNDLPVPETMSMEEAMEAPGLTIIDKAWLALDKPVEVAEKVKSVTSKAIWKTLGVMSWPFERIEYGIGTPAESIIRSIGPLAKSGSEMLARGIMDTPLGRSEYKSSIRDSLTPYAKQVLGKNLEPMLEDAADQVAFGLNTPEMIQSNLAEAKSELPNLIPSVLRGAKSFIPFTRNDPEKVKNFNDFWGAYYETLTGEPSPEWYKQTAGTGSSFVSTPLVFGKMLKTLESGVKKIPFVQKIIKNQLPEWRDAKLIRKAEINERSERAANLGKNLADKEAQRIANMISIQSGKTITAKAVKERLGQIIKGSITERVALQQVANPAIEELEANMKTLQKMGIIAEETYLTKLSPKRIAELKQEQQLLISQAMAKKLGYEIKFSEKGKTVGGALGLYDKRKRVIRVAMGERTPQEIAGTLTHEITHKLHGEIAEDMALQMTRTGAGKYKKYFDDLTKAIFGEREAILHEVEGIKYSEIEKGTSALAKKYRDYFGKPTEVLARAGTFIKLHPEIAEAKFPKTTALFKEFIKKEPHWEEFFGGKEIQPLTTKQIRSIKTAITNPEIEKLLEKADEISQRIYESDIAAGGAKYMPRMYQTKEIAAGERKFPVSGGPKVRAKYAKRREDLSPEERKAMGEIIEPAFPVTKRLIQEGVDIETKKLFDFAASKGEWVDDVWREGLAKKAIPDAKEYGALRGKFVHPKIYSDVMEMNRVKTNLEMLYDSVIGTWKLGKVVLNPATHFRNTFSNSIQLDLSGVDHIEQSRLFIKALQEIKAGSEDYNQARKFFGRTTMITGEMMDDMLRTVNNDNATGIQKTINTWNSFFGKITGVPQEIYQQEEFIFKFMKFLEQREKGKSVIGSVTEANKWLFDYSDLSTFEKNVMRRIMPFYTYPRKALPRVLEAAKDRPLTLAKYPMMAWAMEKYSLHNLDMTDKDYEQVKKVLPEYMQNGSYMLMPFRDANGDLQFFDWTYVVPWGELFDSQDRGLLGDVVTNPIMVVSADIMHNKSGFSGQPIWDETDTPKEQNFKKMLYLWQAAVPSLMYKGIYWDKLYNAVTERPSKMGKVPPLAPAIAHTIFGLRTVPIDVQKQTEFRMREKQVKLRELEGKIRDIVIRASNNNIDEKEYTEKREQYIQQMQAILSDEGENNE